MTAFLVVAIFSYDDTPQQTIQSFVDAFNRRDSAAMGRRVVGKKSSPMQWPKEMPNITATITTVEIEGTKATAQVELVATVPNRPTTKWEDEVILQQVSGDWQIVPKAPDQTSGQKQYLNILARLIDNPQLFTLARTAAKKSTCLSNVKQLALATLMYSLDHKEKYPTSARWEAAIKPYLRGANVFHCPEDPSGGPSYFFEPRLGGLSETNLASPAEIAMIVEGSPKKTAFRHGGRATIGFADAHVKALDPAQVQRARTISLSSNAKRKP